MERFVCIHGHFYQPPRENPWLEEVELQDSAAPFHDWNERITAECYGPNVASRLLNGDGYILDIVNNYSRISFNMGPTLLSWMERHKPDVYEAILEADRVSLHRFSGHGSALAQVYNHMIMPLANRRDKQTQVAWGIRDFERRFKRFPEGMWLPETAADVETLDVLAEQNIKFTILAPRQAKRTRRILRGARWHEARSGIDPTTPYRCQLPSGRSIVLFFYDGPISQDMAFGGLLHNGEHFANRLLSVFSESRDWPQLAHVATDGESYGHHHRHGEMALSYCLHHIEAGATAKITVYGEFLANHPPTHLAEIHNNSSWSCVHGVERWRDNCGCNTGRQGWTQAWRRPLREALDTLRDQVTPLYEKEGAVLFRDSWQTRSDYIGVVLERTPETVDTFLTAHAPRELTPEEKVRALSLLELQRNCMLMYTSCGWFFDEISGIETTQVLQYAARATDYAQKLFQLDFETVLLERLGHAPSNVLKNGAEAYVLYAKPAEVDLLRVGAHYGISSLFTEYTPHSAVYCYGIDVDDYKRLDAGKSKLATGRVRVASNLTLEAATITFAVLHLGGHNVTGGVRAFLGETEYARMREEITTAFERGHMTEVLQLITTHFGTHNYALWHLFRDEQRRVLYQVLQDTLEGVEASFRHIYEDQYPVMNFLQDLRQPTPRALFVAAEYTVNAEIRHLLEQDDPDLVRLENLINQVQRWSFKLEREALGYVASESAAARTEALLQQPDDTTRMTRLNRLLELVKTLGLDIDQWKSQNLYFTLLRDHYAARRLRADTGDEEARLWLEAFRKLGDNLHVSVA